MEPIKYDKVKKNAKVNYYDLFKEILTESQHMEADSETVIRDLGIFIQEKGGEYGPDCKKWEDTIQKLTDLYVLHKLCLGLNLAEYKDLIMNYTIERLFAKPNVPSTILVNKPN